MKERKPSQPMLVMLYHLSQGRPWYAHLRGRSEHGGGERTLKALKQRGFIDNVSAANVTQLGERMLNKYAAHLRGFAPPPADFKAHLRIDELEVEIVGLPHEDPRVVEEKRVMELLEHMRKDGEYDQYFEIPGEDAKLLHRWLKGTIDELQVALIVIRQIARDTYGREMEPKEYAEAAGYDH